jgi:hypothetical protein
LTNPERKSCPQFEVHICHNRQELHSDTSTEFEWKII